MRWLLLVVCAGCGGAPAVDPAVGEGAAVELAPPPPGALVYVAQDGEQHSVLKVSAPRGDSERISPSDGASWFAGPTAIGGRLALLRVTEDPHAEQLAVWTEAAGVSLIGPAAAQTRNPRWEPGGQALWVESSADGFRDIVRVGLADGAQKRSAHAPGCFEPVPLPGGKALAVCSGDDVELSVLAGDGTPRPLLQRAGEDIQPALSPTGSRLAWLGALDGHLHLWMAGLDGAGAGVVWEAPAGHAILPDARLHWAADGRQLALVVRQPDSTPAVWVVSVDGEAERLPVAVPTESPAWLPDGTLMVAATPGLDKADSDIWRVDPRTGAHEVWVTGAGAQWLPRWLSE